VAADVQIDLVLGFRLRDPAGLAQLRTRQNDPRSTDFRRWLRPGEFAERFGATNVDYDAVAAAAGQAGLAITRRTDGRTTLSVRGRAADVERFFGTQLLLWEDGRASDARFRAPSSAFRIPPALDQLVDTVVGLDDANRYHSHRIGPPPSAGTDALPGTAEPKDLQMLYGVTGATHPVTNAPLQGAGETVAILGTGTEPQSGDIPALVTKYSLPTVVGAQYVLVKLGGDTRDPPAFVDQEYGENLLDVDMVLSIAPLANVVQVLTASNAPGLFEDGIAFIVNQVPQAHAVTLSFGTCERVAIPETLQMNALFLQSQAQGQAWFTASGDDGTDGCQDGSSAAIPSPGWPSTSPYVFGVGGTQITGGVEIAWSGGGGGSSELFPKPAWQVGIGPFPNDGAREVPDVSSLAGDPGVATVVANQSGRPQVFPSQGTSAAAPTWAGIWALLDEARDNVGMADYHERIYALGQLGTGAFNDITAGSNGDGTTPGFPALPGFDLATGWGSPNLVLLVGGLP
jgi:kumamolisin